MRHAASFIHGPAATRDIGPDGPAFPADPYAFHALLRDAGLAEPWPMKMFPDALGLPKLRT